MAKIMISIDDSLLERVDNMADEMYTSRSGLLSLAVTEYLNAKQSIGILTDISLQISKIANDVKNVEIENDEEVISQLDTMENICNLLLKQKK